MKKAPPPSPTSTPPGPDATPVGYRRPPKAHQFAPGQSGNPKGRPPGSRNLRTIVAEELARKVTVREGGKKSSLSKGEILVKQVVSDALRGSPKAIQTIISMTGVDTGLGDRSAAAPPSISPEELEILEALKKRLQPDD